MWNYVKKEISSSKGRRFVRNLRPLLWNSVNRTPQEAKMNGQVPCMRDALRLAIGDDDPARRTK